MSDRQAVQDETQDKYSTVVDELALILTTIPKRTAPTQQNRRRKVAKPRPMPPPLPPPPQRPAQLQHAIDTKLMTFDELAGKIGHQPRADKLGGRWKMSKRYKVLQTQVGGSQDKVEELEARPATDLQNTRDQVERELTDQIDALIAAASSYRDSKRKSGKKDAASALIDQANTYKTDLKANLDKVLADPKFADIAAHCTIGEAVAAKVRGLNFKDCKFDVHNDTKLDAGNSVENFGSGAVNSVSKLVHEDGTPRVFKPEPTDDKKMKLGPKLAGIDPNSPHYGNRNVASKIAADLLGLDVMPDASFATHGGEVGLVMSMAKGNSPRVKVWEDYDQASAENEPEVNRKNYGLEKRNGVWKRGREVMQKPWQGDLSDNAKANLQEQLNGLEWTDLLTGQVDRHSGNYFVDVQGDTVKVTGIDNDFCFGKQQTGLLKYDTSKGITSVGQPRLIDKKTHDRMVQVDFDRDMLPKLTGLLTDDEINASRDRINRTVALARQMQIDGLVVDNWKTWRSPGAAPNLSAKEYLDGGPPRSSLMQRDMAGWT